MTDDLEKIVERVQKILALGRRGGTEAEAAAAMAKAQELLTRHNLDMARVEGAPAATREKVARDTGMYLYQRSLWASVARLNFCLCFRDQVYEQYRGGRMLWRNKMFIVGRKVNTRATLAMGGYLEQVVDRLCRERLAVHTHYEVRDGSLHQAFFSGWAVSFREGVVSRVLEKIEDRLKRVDAAEARRQRELDKQMSADASAATAVSILVYQDAETDANLDFLHGPGYAARKAAQRAEYAAEAARAEKEYAEWAAANPEEAAAADKARRKSRWRGGPLPRERKVDWGAYRAGREAGAGVGIDPQAEAGSQKKIAHR